MGRIAEALKKAEQQRNRNLHAAAPGSSGARTPTPVPAPDGQPADSVPATTSASPEPSECPPRIAGMSEALVAYYEPSSVISEQYRSLRTGCSARTPTTNTAS